MDPEKLTIKAQEALKGAQEVARRHSNQEVGPEHLLAALLAQTDSLIPPLLQKLGVPAPALAAAVQEEIDRKVKVQGDASSDLFPARPSRKPSTPPRPRPASCATNTSAPSIFSWGFWNKAARR
jgi:ATP-dependent Clp protease ATP-binding subunit ClpA